MGYNKIFIVTILLAILAIGAVSASEDISDDVAAVEPSDDLILNQIDEGVSTEPSDEIISNQIETESSDKNLDKEDSQDKISEENELSLTDLKNTLESDDVNITLTKDYKYNPDTDEDITNITTQDFKLALIDGQGHTIDGGGKDLILNVQSRDLVIKNLIFKNFNRTIEIESGIRDFIQWNGHNGTLENCTFENISASRAGQLLALQGSSYDTYFFHLNGCTFKDIYMDAENEASIFIHMYTSNVIINNCSFTNVSCDNFISDESNVMLNNIQINNCNFYLNNASNEFIRLRADSSQINNCTFSNNHGGGFGYLTYQYGNNSRMYNCTFEHNFATAADTYYDFPISRFGYHFGTNPPIVENITVTNVTYRDNVGIPIQWDADNGNVTGCIFENNNGTIKLNKGTVYRDNGKYDFELSLYNDTVVGAPDDSETENLLLDLKYYGEKTGRIVIVLNGTECFNKELEGNSASIKLDDLSDVPMVGEVPIVVRFVNSQENLEVYVGTVSIDYYLGLIIDILKIVLNPHSTITLNIALPKDATGSLYFYDGVNDNPVEYADGRATYTLNASIYDEMGKQFKPYLYIYDDSKYPFKPPSQNYVVTVMEKIDEPICVSQGETAYIFYDFPDDYEGNIELYNETENGMVLIFNESVKGLGKIELPFILSQVGNYSFKLINDVFGEKEFKIECIKNNESVHSSIDSNITGLGGNFTISVDSQLANSTLYVLVDGNNYLTGDFEKFELDGTTFTHSISNLALGEHIIELFVSALVEVPMPWGGLEYEPMIVYSNSFPAYVKSSLGLSIDDVGDVEQGKDLTINISANQAFSGTVAISVNNVEIGNASLTDGKGNFTIAADKLNLGSNTVKVIFKNNDAFFDDSAEISFNVKLDPDLVIADVDVVEEGKAVTIDITANQAFSGIVSVSVNGVELGNASLTDGKGNFTIAGDKLNLGENSVKAVSEANDIFLEGIAELSINVKPNPGLAIADVDDVEQGKAVTIDITANQAFSGIVSVSLNGVELGNASLTDGKGNFTIDALNLNLGENTVKVVSEASDLFVAGSAENSFIVKSNPDLAVADVGDVGEGNDVPIDITANQAFSGIVSVSLNGVELGNASLTDGKGDFTIAGDKLNLGENSVKVVSEASDLFIASSAENSFIVKRNTGLAIADVGVVGEGIPVTIDISANQAFSGTVAVSLNNVGIGNASLTNGKGNFNIAALKLNLGSNTVKVSIENNETFLDDSAEISFNVKRTPDLAVANVSDVELSKPVTIDINADETFSDIVTVYVNDADTGTVVLSKGIARYEIAPRWLKPGLNTVRVTIENNDAFFDDSAEISFSVKYNPNLLIADMDDIIEGNPAIININANDTLSTVVSVSLNGEELGNTTMTAGVASFEIAADKLKLGQNTVVVSSKATDLFIAGSDEISFYVNPKDDGNTTPSDNDSDNSTPSDNGSGNSSPAKKVPVKIVAKDYKAYYNKGIYKVKVYGTNGKLAKGVKVVFRINGKKVKTVTTNKKGIATFKIPKKYVPKKYRIKITALGKTVTKKLVIKQVLKLKKVKIKKSAKRLVIKASLKEGKKALKGKKIIFKFKGKKYKRKTNKKGIAKLVIKKKVLKKLKKGKKLTYKATYLKDTVKRTVKVKK